MNVPEPVMSLAVQPVSKDSGGQVTYVNFEAETTTYFSFNLVLRNLQLKSIFRC
jgi:hypothetical protein